MNYHKSVSIGIRLMDTFVFRQIKPIQIIIGFSILLGSCSMDSKTIEINFGSNNHVLERHTIYLYDVIGKSVVDSTVVESGRAIFNTKQLGQNVPSQLCIKFHTLDSMKYLLPFGIRNPYLKNTFESCFYFDNENILLDLDTTYKGSLGLEPYTLRFRRLDLQNEISYKRVSVRVGPGSHRFNANLVKRYPNSMEILYTMYLNRAKIPSDSIVSLLEMFNGSSTNSEFYRSLRMYSQASFSSAYRFPDNVQVNTASGALKSQIIVPNKWNLIVFWASWCGPCRAEIPQIRSLKDANFDNLSITSISVDNNHSSWIKALNMENMKWHQYIVTGQSKAALDKQFSLEAIPVWLLFNPDGKLVHRNIGYNDGEKSLDKVVKKFILE